MDIWNNKKLLFQQRLVVDESTVVESERTLPRRPRHGRQHRGDRLPAVWAATLPCDDPRTTGGRRQAVWLSDAPWSDVRPPVARSIAISSSVSPSSSEPISSMSWSVRSSSSARSLVSV